MAALMLLYQWQWGLGRNEKEQERAVLHLDLVKMMCVRVLSELSSLGDRGAVSGEGLDSFFV